MEGRSFIYIYIYIYIYIFYKILISGDFTVPIDNWEDHLAHSSQMLYTFMQFYKVKVFLVCSYLLQYLRMILQRQQQKITHIKTFSIGEL